MIADEESRWIAALATMGFAEGTGLLWLAGMANGVRFFGPPYWKIEQAEKRAAQNPYYAG